MNYNSKDLKFRGVIDSKIRTSKNPRSLKLINFKTKGLSDSENPMIQRFNKNTKSLNCESSENGKI